MTAPSTGPKNSGMPPMKVARSTPPERAAETFSALTISKLMHESAPDTPAKKAARTSCRKRTLRVS